MDLITLNVAENMKEYGGNVTLSGMLIVFSMLIALVVIISVFGMIMSRATGAPKKEKPKKEPKLEKKSEALSTTVVNTATSTEDEDVIAAISAAVMMMYEGTGKTPVIRSIRPAAKGVRSAWATAGIMNNTRSF